MYHHATTTGGRPDVRVTPEQAPADPIAALIRYHEMRLRHLKSEVSETERLLEVLRRELRPA